MARFKKMGDTERLGSIADFHVIQDTKTGVLYSLVKEWSAGGLGMSMTVLVDQDGKPLVAKGFVDPEVESEELDEIFSKFNL